MRQSSTPDFVSRLLAAASAADNDSLDWPKIHSKLKDAPHGLTDRERCELLIASANGEAIPLELQTRLVGRRFVSGGSKHAAASTTQQLQSWCKANLSIFFDLDERGRKEFATDCHRDLLGKVLVAPGYDDNGRRDQVLTLGINAAMQYALSILTDGKREFASLLCRCEYSKCGIFFFEKEPEGGGRGARIRKFCSTEHAIHGDREKSAKRSKERRNYNK